MNGDTPGLAEREARISAAVLKARAAGADPYAPIFMGSGRRAGLVDPVERGEQGRRRTSARTQGSAWMLYADPATAG